MGLRSGDVLVAFHKRFPNAVAPITSSQMYMPVLVLTTGVITGVTKAFEGTSKGLATVVTTVGTGVQQVRQSNQGLSQSTSQLVSGASLTAGGRTSRVLLPAAHEPLLLGCKFPGSKPGGLQLQARVHHTIAWSVLCVHVGREAVR
jgi:hypothetical protein